jgi:hypothetical protein
MSDAGPTCRRLTSSGPMRRALVWMVVLPLTAGGCLAAHALAYRSVASNAHERENLLALTGHGYLGYAPLALGVLVAVLVVALGLVAAGAARGSPGPRPSAWPFFILPLLGFVVQENAERFVHDGSLSAATMLEPALFVGVILQVPFALAAFLVARALLAVAEVMGRSLAVVPNRCPLAPVVPHVLPGAADLARIPVLALGYPERGPPSGA